MSIEEIQRVRIDEKQAQKGASNFIALVAGSSFDTARAIDYHANT